MPRMNAPEGLLCRLRLPPAAPAPRPAATPLYTPAAVATKDRGHQRAECITSTAHADHKARLLSSRQPFAAADAAPGKGPLHKAGGGSPWGMVPKVCWVHAFHSHADHARPQTSTACARSHRLQRRLRALQQCRTDMPAFCGPQRFVSYRMTVDVVWQPMPTMHAFRPPPLLANARRGGDEPGIDGPREMAALLVFTE